jgi:sporulation and spore germination protein/immunoglobulin-like protein involved in spore germination
MNARSQARRFGGPASTPTLAAAFVLALFAAVACGPLTGDLGGVATPPPTEQPSLDVPSSEPTPGGSPSPTGSAGPIGSPAPPASASPAPAGTTTVRAYFFLGSFTDNAGLVPVLREVPKTQAVGAAAMHALLEGPNAAELGASPAMYTTIPDGTIFLGLHIDAGVATVNLSKEFEQDDAVSAEKRLAQVVYTLTQFPTVHGVSFELDGAPVRTFGSEGIALGSPVDRATWTDQLPAIFVDRPAWGGVLANPARVAGLTDVFEARFRVRILDGNGRSLADVAVDASCGTGCWGTFDQTIAYSVAHAGWGTLRVYDRSAKDGSVENRTEYPVWLTP